MDTTTPATKKTVAILFLLFFILTLSYKPWDNGGSIDSGIKHIFYLFFFIFNQTLGIIHEGGHGVCYILKCPQFITALNGTLFQVLFPLMVWYYYKRRGNIIGSLIALFITGFSLSYTAWYISTSNMGLHVPASKSFLGVDGYHDFNYILTQIGLLDYYVLISILVKFISLTIMGYSIFLMFANAFLDDSNTQ